MALATVEFFVCALIIIVAGTFLTRYADGIADLTGLGRLLVGSILLAGATSLPELSVDISAVYKGFADLAVGDLVGSCLFNLLILAVMDLIHRSRGRLFNRMAGAHALSATMSVMLLTLAALALILRSHLTFLRMGMGSFAILATYVLGMRLVYYDQRHAAAEAGDSQEVLLPADHLTLRRALIGFAISAVVIIVTAPYLAESAEKLAQLTGLGRTFVGTTLVALSTSLPEVVTTLAAMRMGAFDLALGNIFGSNSFNMLVLVPLDLVHPGSLLADVSPTHAVTALAAVVITAVAIMGQLYRAEKRFWLIEPDAVLVMILVLGALGLVYHLR